MTQQLRAGVVVTGTEMLTGAIADANGPWVAAQLGAAGVEVSHLLTVGDRAADLHAALDFLRAQQVGLIVTSGGLGPTADDLTAQVVAEFAGAPLRHDPALHARIEAILARFPHLSHVDQDALRAATRKQALVPDGADVVEPTGTAPGLAVRVDGGPTVLVLPGPPRELQAMWGAALATPAATAALAGVVPFESVRLRLLGVPESDIAATLRDAGERLDLAALEITTCLREAELEVDIRHRGAASAVSAALVDEIVERHGHRVFSTDGSTIDDRVAALLDGHLIATAESCTGGLLAGRLTARAGSSAYAVGGVVAYSNAVKTAALGVPADLIERHGAVSPEVARAMADGARERLGADVGVGITGVAGPGGGSDTKPVGYVCLCVSTDAGVVVTRDPVLPGDRTEVRQRSVALAMHLVRRALERDAHR